MRLTLALCLATLCALLPSFSAADENRCGWFANPTPGNAWLTDRDGEWTISTQGGKEADGDWPDFKPRDWVVTNSGDHGYGCACMSVSVDRKEKRILAIKSATPKPLAACRNDRTLREPK
ncbi:MAG: hypothetical protein JWN73_2463 [Betaproteobacteria bacterium]|nr:hypothetical protein [Betaproteobacteria bacterium]